MGISRGSAVLASAAAMVVALSACGSSDSGNTSSSASTAADSGSAQTCRIGFSYGNTTGGAYQDVVRFARERANEKGCELIEGAAAGDPAKQVNEIQQWIANKQVDAVVVLPIGGSLDPTIKQAKDADIAVVGYSQELPGGDAAILYNNVKTGQQLADAAIAWAKENFAGRMKDFSYGIFTYDQCGAPCTERTDTIKDALKQDLGVTPAATGDAVATDTGLKQAESILQAHPDLSMFLSVDDAAALGAQKAFEQAGKTKDVFIGGMDGTKEALQAVADGGIYKATSALQISDIGNAVVDLPKQILDTGKADNIVIQPVLVDSKQTAEQMLTEQFGGGQS